MNSISPANPSVHPACIKAGWLIDGSGESIRHNVLVRIGGGCIKDICDTGTDNPMATNVLDLSESTVLPGLIDCHVHLFMSGNVDRQIRDHMLEAGYGEARHTISRHVSQHLRSGVVAVRDGGDKGALAFRYKNQHLNQRKIPLVLKVAGRAWRSRGRYGRLIGRAPSGNKTLSEALSENLNGIDHVKIVNSGLNSLVKFGRQTPPQFSLQQMRAAVNEAGRSGLKVMVHANGEEPVKIAVEAGCHSIEHGFFMGRENLERMADNRITWIPTAVTMKAYADNMAPAARELDVCRRNLAHQLEQMRVARGLGVPVALGTDAGSPGVHHGTAVRGELELLMEAGYPVEEAVGAATKNGANLLGMEGQGLLAQGRPATFIAVRGGPEKLPESLSNIEVICIDGETITGNGCGVFLKNAVTDP